MSGRMRNAMPTKPRAPVAAAAPGAPAISASITPFVKSVPSITANFSNWLCCSTGSAALRVLVDLDAQAAPFLVGHRLRGHVVESEAVRGLEPVDSRLRRLRGRRGWLQPHERRGHRERAHCEPLRGARTGMSISCRERSLAEWRE